ncbi:pilin [Candidatus Saccharibacteria bacterium]|nr:pilin [Candidatus Saccharibacteria bacterium]
MLAILFVKMAPFFFAAACTPAKTRFLFLPPWWEYLKGGTTDALGQCAPNFTFPGDIWSVGLAILDMLLRIAGFVAVISIIVAGFQHQFTMGDPQKAAAARRRIYNSLIGLAIALVATALVTFIGNQLAK